jgi:hypothetical protein
MASARLKDVRVLVGKAAPGIGKVPNDYQGVGIKHPYSV